MPLASKGSNAQQIAQAVLDTEKQAIRTTFEEPINVTFTSGDVDVSIDAETGDNISIADAVTGEKAQVVDGKLQVDVGALTVDGDFTIPPSTAFSAKTVSATTTPTQLTFSSLTTVTSIAIKALSTNTGNVFVSDTSAFTDFATLEPGDATTLPVFKGTQVWYLSDGPAGVFQLTAIAVN